MPNIPNKVRNSLILSQLSRPQLFGPARQSAVGMKRRIAAKGLLLLPFCVSTSAWAAPNSADPAANAPSTSAASPSAASPTSPGETAPEPAVTVADAKKKAKEHFETGLRLYEDGDYSLALIEFERAYSFVPDFRVLYNIGQVSIQLARYARASQALEQYLKNGGAKIPSARASSVHNDLKMLEGRTAHLMVNSNVEGAEILLDESILSKTPVNEPLLVDAGEHRITLQKPGYVTRTEPLVLAGRDESTLQIDLVEESKAQQMQERQPLMPSPEAQQRMVFLPPVTPAPRKSELLYVGWGATGVLAVGWAVTGYVGIKAAGDLHNALNQPATAGELQSLKVKAQGWLLASDIVGATALVAGGTTLYFSLKRPSREQPTPHVGMTNLNFGLGPGAVQLNGTFE